MAPARRTITSIAYCLTLALPLPASQAGGRIRLEVSRTVKWGPRLRQERWQAFLSGYHSGQWQAAEHTEILIFLPSVPGRKRFKLG